MATPAESEHTRICLIPKRRSRIYGGIAQLVEHRLCKPEVVGSIPSTSTRI